MAASSLELEFSLGLAAKKPPLFLLHIDPIYIYKITRYGSGEAI